MPFLHHHWPFWDSNPELHDKPMTAPYTSAHIFKISLSFLLKNEITSVTYCWKSRLKAPFVFSERIVFGKIDIYKLNEQSISIYRNKMSSSFTSSWTPITTSVGGKTTAVTVNKDVCTTCHKRLPRLDENLLKHSLRYLLSAIFYSSHLSCASL